MSVKRESPLFGALVDAVEVNRVVHLRAQEEAERMERDSLSSLYAIVRSFVNNGGTPYLLGKAIGSANYNKQHALINAAFAAVGGQSENISEVAAPYNLTKPDVLGYDYIVGYAGQEFPVTYDPEERDLSNSEGSERDAFSIIPQDVAIQIINDIAGRH